MINWLRALARAPSLWLFLLLLSLYCLTLGGEFYISDGEVVFQTTVALATSRSLALECNPGLPQILPGSDGQCFSKYGLGSPLLSVLPYRFGRVLARTVFAGTDAMAIGHFFVSFMNQVLTAATGVVLYLFARHLYDSRWLGLLLALLYGVATSAWPYSKVYFSEPLIAFLTLLAAYAIYRYPGRHGLAWLALAGLALGYAVLTKVATIMLLPIFGLYLLWRLLGRPWLRQEPSPPAPPPAPSNFIRIGPRLAARQALRRPSRRVDPEAINRFPVPLRTTAPAGGRRTAMPLPTLAPPPAPPPVKLTGRALVSRLLVPLVVFGVPMAICAALLLWHNAARFGSPFDNGYTDEGFTTPFYVGLYGFLFSSGKSLFLYSPPVVLSVPALVLLWWRRPVEALLCASIFLVTLFYYSAWWAWYGGWSWGPRFLVPTLPFLVLPLGVLLLERRWARLTILPLAVVSIGVQLLGALVDFNPYIAGIVADNPENEAKYIFYPWLSPLVGHLRFLLQGQYIAVATFDMTRLGFPGWFALLFPPLVIATLLASASALIMLFWPRARGLTRGRS